MEATAAETCLEKIVIKMHDKHWSAFCWLFVYYIFITLFFLYLLL